MPRRAKSDRPRPPSPAGGFSRGALALLARAASGDAGAPVPDALLATARELERRDLARLLPGGRLVATQAGRARIARAEGGEAGFLAQHRTLGRRRVEVDARVEEALVDLDESPLAWLARRRGRDGAPLLGAHEVLAGERLRADFTRGQMTPRVTANWEAAISSGRRGAPGAGVDLADAVAAAQARVRRALDAVGPELSGPLIDVCCFLKGLEAVERERGWPARGAKLVLGLALARLARHYGYAEPRGAAGPAKILRWGTPDSRPTIDGETRS